MKNAFIIFFLIFGSIILRAQDISVTSFSPLPNDLTANTAGTEVKDQNGEKTALIKVVTTQTGFTFEGGALGITKVKQENGEVWVYVPQKSKKITIKHSQLGVLRDYYFPCAIESARTYEMVLTSGVVETVVKKDAGGNFLTIKVQPENASVYIDGIFQQNVPQGEYSIFLGYGEHTYRIEAAGYSTQSGIANIGKEVKSLSIKLESALSSLTINCPTEGAQLFLNKKLKGVDKWSGTVSAGTYLIEAVKEGFRNSLENIEIGENENRTVSLPALQPIYGMLKVNVKPIGSIIEIDGKSAGKTPTVINDIIIGKHSVKIIAANGNQILKNVEIKEGEICSVEDIIPNITAEQHIELSKSAYKEGDYKKAYDNAYKAASMGNANAQNILGVCYYYGRGVEKDLRKAFEWWDKAASQGDLEAKNNMFYVYFSNGEPQSDYSGSSSKTTAIYSDGSYKGQLVDGVPHGLGRMTYSDGSYYDGNWVNGRKEGNGKYFDAETNIIQEGIYINGICSKVTDEYVIGSRNNNSKSNATMIYDDGSYKGPIAYGKPHGKGRLTYKDGSYYDGNWVNGKKEGNGKYYDPKTNIIQEGIYINGICSRVIDEYDAESRNNNSSSNTTTMYGGGSYEGQTVDGIPHGKGRMTYKEGSYYDGDWSNGIMHGKGKFYDSKNNIMQEGVYDKGICKRVLKEYKMPRK